MIYSYNEIYLDDAMTCLGEAFDYAVYSCNSEMDYFLEQFINRGYAEKFQNGNPDILSGRSGTELAMLVIDPESDGSDFPDPRCEFDYSCEYWCGWILAYFQWESGMSFKDIERYINMKEIAKLYPVMHEAHEEKAADTIKSIIRKRLPVSRLKERRTLAGYSQRQLAEKSGVNLRTLQQYETRAKDVNKASCSSVLSMARVLSCNVEDIMEFDI